MNILIRNGLVIDPANNIEQELDLLVEDGQVKELAKPGSFGKVEAETFDAAGKLVAPGLIDLHVHLREPGFEWKETIRTGCEAAVYGGFSSICCMPNTQPRNDRAEITKFILDKATQAGLCRVLPIGSVSKELLGKEMSPLSELKEAGCVAFSDDGEPVWNAGLMRRALEWAGMLNMTISCHEEDKSLSCGGCMNESALSTKLGLRGMHNVAEDVMVARDIELCRVTGARVHICHISTARSLELVRRAKNDRINITCEVTPHHLVLNEDLIGDYNTNAKMSPPLRLEADRLALVEGLKDGTIDAIASDHAPHERDTKEVEFAKASFGILGLQTTLPLILQFVKDGVISRKRGFELMTSGPARAFGQPFGTLGKGAVADLIIIDPNKNWTFDRNQVRSLSFNSPFIGRTMLGRVETVVVAGKIVLRNGLLSVGAG